jgi:predicted phosphoribosyltransferase
MIFHDRIDAGQQLARKLEHLQGQDAIVLALPRGGVPIGVEVAKHLHVPLDVFVARKLGAPGNPEFGVGAIAEGGIIVIDKQSLSFLGLAPQDLEDTIVRESAEVERRLALYRGNRHNLQVENKVIILVDDGLATGVTALAAIRALRLAKPKKLILAVPVCAEDTAKNLRSEVDELICLHPLKDFTAVGIWYENFEQLTDQEVMDILARAHREIKVK